MPTRREFLQTTTSAGAAVAAAPLFLGASDKAGSKPVTIGKGDHTYVCEHNWGKLPANFNWFTTHGVCVDSAGLIYVSHLAKQDQETVVVFDAYGKFVRSFGKAFSRGGHGIDCRKEGSEEFLYHSDVHHRIVAKTTLKGKEIWRRGFPKASKKYKNERGFKPTNVAFHPDGSLFVGDGYGSHFIHHYSADGEYKSSFGGVGKAPGQMRTPHGMWVDNRKHLKQPRLVVADRANARLQNFSLDGKHLGFVEGLSFPADVDVRGDVLLVPDLHARVTLLDKNDKVISHLGYDAEWTKKALAKFAMRRQPKRWETGRFIHPHDAAFDSAGNIFVTEWVVPGRVTKLRKV